MTLAQALADAVRLGLDRLDAELLLLFALGRAPIQRAWLLAHGTDALPPNAGFEALALRRAQGEPLAYITGHKEFYGLDLQIDARVLDPRADTETLVDWALEVAPPQGTVVDLGTGSGAIALALKHIRPDLQVQAVDASASALAVARANGERLRLAIGWHQGHWLQALQGQFDAIVANPPYIASGDAHLAALQHEPREALVSGAQGMDDIRAIIGQAPTRLLAGGWLLLEHGHDQAQATRSLLRAAGFQQVQSRRDLAGIERCSGGQL